MLKYIMLVQRYAKATGMKNPDVSIGVSAFDDRGFSVAIRVGELAEDNYALQFTHETLCTTWCRTHDNPWQPDVEVLKIMFDMVDRYIEQRERVGGRPELHIAK